MQRDFETKRNLEQIGAELLRQWSDELYNPNAAAKVAEEERMLREDEEEERALRAKKKKKARRKSI